LIKVAFHPDFVHPLPEGHKFPMEKYELIPKQLLHQGIIEQGNLFEPKLLDEDILLATHHHNYWHQVKNLSLLASQQRKIGFVLNDLLVARELRIMQGTLDCALYALKHGVALNIAGGTHHAFANKGEGFCIFNDFAIAANYLLYKQLVKKILILDLDVHQGNGTASLFGGNNYVFTFSMHGRHNYPFFKEKSDLDIELDDGTNDNTYLNLLEESLLKISKIFLPDFIFYQSGVDILATDKFGKLNITMQACKQRDEMVFSFAAKHSIPVSVAMGGGYSPNIADILNAHCNTFKTAIDILGN